MRSIVVTLGLALVASSAQLAAQQPSGVLLHSHDSSPMRKLDFGLKQALAVVVPSQLQAPAPHPQHEVLTVLRTASHRVLEGRVLSAAYQPLGCAMVKTHKHELLTTATPVVTPQAHTKHQLKVVTVPACPGR